MEAERPPSHALEAALCAAGVGTWQWAGGDAPLRLSPVAVELLGAADEELTPAAYLAYVHPDDRAAVAVAFHDATPTERPVFVPHRLAAAPGRWLEVRGRGTTSGGARLLAGTLHEVTAHKQSEEQLAGDRAFVATVLDTVSALVVVLDAQERIRLFSRACEVATGFTEAEVLGKSFIDLFVLPEEAAAVRCVFERLLARDFPNRHENFWRRRDGSRVRIAWANAAVLGPDGAVRYVIGTGIDVTEARATAEALRASEERLALALDASGLGTWDWRIDSDRITFDARGLAALAMRAEDAPRTADEWRELVHPSDRAALRRTLDDHVAGVTPLFEAEHRLLTGEGRYTWFLARGKVVARREEGAATRMAGTLVDITERKHMEAKALRAQRLESLGTIAGGIAHDLNNTLSPILLAVDTLRDERPELAQEELLTLVRGSAARGARLVQQVLHFARGVSGIRAPVDAAQLARDATLLLRETFPRAVQVVLELPDAPCFVEGDVTLLQQVLVNLCVNARDAMPAGGTLTVSAEGVHLDPSAARARPGLFPGEWVRLRVADTGEGISPEHQELLFDPFFTTKEPGKGTGLGLPMVLTIVRSHGGFITVESAPGAGAVFDVYLPALAAGSLTAAEGELGAASAGLTGTG